jgi:hypothetical protein
MGEIGEETTHFELTLRRGEALFEQDRRHFLVKAVRHTLADASCRNDYVDLTEVTRGVVLQQ